MNGIEGVVGTSVVPPGLGPQQSQANVETLLKMAIDTEAILLNVGKTLNDKMATLTGNTNLLNLNSKEASTDAVRPLLVVLRSINNLATTLQTNAANL